MSERPEIRAFEERLALERLVGHLCVQVREAESTNVVPFSGSLGVLGEIALYITRDPFNTTRYQMCRYPEHQSPWLITFELDTLHFVRHNEGLVSDIRAIRGEAEFMTDMVFLKMVTV